MLTLSDFRTPGLEASLAVASPAPLRDVARGEGVTTTRVITYTYDPLNRLISATYSTSEVFEYAYDAVGNRTAMTTTEGTTAYTYDAANRLTSAGSVTYTWDARGNLTSDGTFTYTYNAAGRLVRAESVTTTLVYTYNAQGLRVVQSTNGKVTNFVWDWTSSLSEMLSDGNNLYLVGHDTLGHHGTAGWHYYLADALGSVRQVVNRNGIVAASQNWTPFGVPMIGGAEPALGYTGEWWDADAELVYLRARWMQPRVGRFTQLDAWSGSRRRPQTHNGYSYVEGNAINLTDSGGLCSQTGWNNRSGLFTEANCDRLERGTRLGWAAPADLLFIKQWYYDFADEFEDMIPQTATHFRHFLDGSGSELKLPADFIKTDILEYMDVVERAISKLSDWYVDYEGSGLPVCVATSVGPDVYHHEKYFYPFIPTVWLFRSAQVDVLAALGGFHVYVWSFQVN